MPLVTRDGEVLNVEWSQMSPQERAVRQEIDRTNVDLRRERRLRGLIPRAANSSKPEVPSLPAATIRRSGRPRRPAVVDDPFLKAEWAGVGRPPISNTGAAATEVGTLFRGCKLKIDNLGVSFPVEKLEDVRHRVSRYLGGAQDRLFGLNTYRLSAVWESGAKLAWTDGRGEAFVTLNGQSVDRLNHEELHDFMRWMRLIGGKCTRIDLAFDDYLRIVPIDVVVANAKAGNLVHFRRIDPRQPIDALSGEKAGDGIYFGSRGKDGSGKYLRLYDKFIESGYDPEQDCNRWELELTDEYAVDAFTQLCNCPDVSTLATRIGAIIGGAIDFKLRKGYERHIERAPRLCWWDRILQIIGQSALC